MAEAQVFRREGDYWTITYGGTTVRMRDAVGIHYLGWLLAHPNQPCAAEELLATVRGTEAADVLHARWAVGKRIRDSLRRIAEHHPTLGYHLRAGIRAGATCVYVPDPRDGQTWVT
jgi:hypothetical protein